MLKPKDNRHKYLLAQDELLKAACDVVNLCEGLSIEVKGHTETRAFFDGVNNLRRLLRAAGCVDG